MLKYVSVYSFKKKLVPKTLRILNLMECDTHRQLVVFQNGDLLTHKHN